MDTRHGELDWFSGRKAKLQKILADRVTVDRALRIRGVKAVRLNTGRNLYGFFTEGGRQVETLNIDAIRTVSELDEVLDEMVARVEAVEEREGDDGGG